jgi:hypothetical protein
VSTLLASRGIAVERTSAATTSERAKGLGQLLAKRPAKEDLEKKQIIIEYVTRTQME